MAPGVFPFKDGNDAGRWRWRGGQDDVQVGKTWHGMGGLTKPYLSWWAESCTSYSWPFNMVKINECSHRLLFSGVSSIPTSAVFFSVNRSRKHSYQFNGLRSMRSPIKQEDSRCEKSKKDNKKNKSWEIWRLIRFIDLIFHVATRLPKTLGRVMLVSWPSGDRHNRHMGDLQALHKCGQHTIQWKLHLGGWGWVHLSQHLLYHQYASASWVRLRGRQENNRSTMNRLNF